MEGRRKCRLWWPSNAFSPNSSFLFGWFFKSPEASIDVVVAFARDELKFDSSIDSSFDLQEIIQGTNKNMPAVLQDKSTFSLLGYFEADVRSNGLLVGCGNDENKYTSVTCDQSQDTCTSNHESCSCVCSKNDRGVWQGHLAALDTMWIKLVHGVHQTVDGRVLIIPKLDHLHLNSEILSNLDLHDLHQRDPNPDLDIVIQAMNSAGAAQILFDGHRNADSGLLFRIVYMFSTSAWKLFAVSVATVSTVIYIILQSLGVLFSWLSRAHIDMILSKVFSNTMKNIHFRCCQLLYWPIFLHDLSIRSWSCVEFAEKAALRQHSIWSNILVDVLLGNAFGIPLWFMLEPTCLWVSRFAHDFTNNWMRTGCVWLMGNPAGFKLNTELAGVLGMISLNAIQIWSTLWVSMGFLFIHFTKGLALCAILFGFTSAAALIVDMISLVTMHVLTLHLFLSLLYSTQIQAVAALWRLFRGQKRNPLRHRLDSYDFTVEQHVVGSLLFTPILLLLPTTSAFYIFFTILHTAMSFICIAVEATISFIHATPYAKVFLWLKRRKRFPSGICFEVTLWQHSPTGSVSGSNSSNRKLQKSAYASTSSQSSNLVSFLHSNYLNLGEVVWLHYRDFYSGFSKSSISSSAYGILTGTSTLYAPGSSLPVKLPWIVIPWKEFWRLCRDSVYSCKGYPHNRRSI